MTVRTVLLVDDVAVVRHLLKLVLESTGQFHVVGEADDGESAIVAAGHLRPDVVLLDLSMPGMDGLEALPLIRAAAPSATVVVNSGFAAERAARTAIEAGAAAYLEKGLEPSEVVERVLAAVGGERGTVADSALPDGLDRVLASMAGLLVGVEATWWEPLLEHITDGVVVVDQAGQLQAWNAAAESMLESGDVLAGRSIASLGWELCTPSGALLELARWVDEIAARPTQFGKATLRRGVEQLDVCAVVVPGQSGRGGGVVVMLNDQRSARELERAVRHADAVANLVREAVLMVDRAGNICAWNKSAQRMFGWDAAAIEGRPVTTLFAPGHASDVDAMIASARSQLGSAGRAVTGVARDGRLLALSVGAESAAADGSFVTVVIGDVAVPIRTEIVVT